MTTFQQWRFGEPKCIGVWGKSRVIIDRFSLKCWSQEDMLRLPFITKDWYDGNVYAFHAKVGLTDAYCALHSATYDYSGLPVSTPSDLGNTVKMYPSSTTFLVQSKDALVWFKIRPPWIVTQQIRKVSVTLISEFDALIAVHVEPYDGHVTLSIEE